jgi:hypothetical protein
MMATHVDHPDASSPPWTIGPADPGLDAGPPYVPPDTSCLPTTTLPAEKTRLDMYLVMDANITLPYTGLWEFTTAGLRAFVMDPRSAGIGVGLRFFGLECDPDAYDLDPTVEVDLLPANASAIAAATEAETNFNTSPMAPALQGGINHQRRRATAHPDWKQVVVLISDGFTEDISCVYTAQDLESDASNGFIGPPSIETYVLGFGFPATPMIATDILERFSPLDSIASSGGTAQAITVTSSGDPTMMNEALQQIRRTAQPCEYVVPPEMDPTQLSLVLTPGGELPRVDADIGCGRLPGWYFDDPTKPTRMVLCPVSCQAMQKDDSETAVLFYGCPSARR